MWSADRIARAARTVGAAAVVAVAVAIALWPGAAHACPMCATGDDGGIGRVALLVAMIAVPFVVALVAAIAIRRHARRQR